MLKEKTDEELMLAYQLGDENAFSELYARHSARVLGFLRTKTQNEAKAYDIFQATFLKLHRSRGRYNPALPFVPWLFTICRNELLDVFRKEKILREEIVVAVPEKITQQLSAREIDLTHLNTNQKEAIQLRYGDDASFEEIAKALETSPANVRQIISRALKTLRNIYGKE